MCTHSPPSSPPIQAATQQCVLSASELTPIFSREQVTLGPFLSRCGRVNSSLTVLSQDKASTANTDRSRLTQTFWAESLKTVPGSGVKDLGDNCQRVRLLSQSRCSDLNPCPFPRGTQPTPWNPPSPSSQETPLPVSCDGFPMLSRKPAGKINFLKSCISEKSICSIFYLIDNLNESKSKAFLICNPLYVTFFFFPFWKFLDSSNLPGYGFILIQPTLIIQ